MQNTASQNAAQSGETTWLRNSTDVPRKIKSQSTIMSGR